MKHIVVTGGAGFIGSNLVKKLLEKRYYVKVLDNLSTGCIDNISEFMSDPNFKFVECSICDYNVCLNELKGADVVSHQAALGSVPRSIVDPISSCNNNINGFLNILQAAKENGVKRVVYASSSAVYGDNTDMPKIEEKTGNPLSPYAITKITDEMYANVFSTLHDIECIGLRYFNVFGEKQSFSNPYSAVIPKFVYNILINKQPIIYGNGESSRDFTYIENVILANVLAIETNNKAAVNTVYNVACGNNITVNELYNKINSILETDIKPIYAESRKGDIPHSLANIDKISINLGYKPIYNIDEGLKRAVKYYVETIRCI